MKTSKLNEYKKMDEKALQKELKDLKQELFKLRFSHAMNGLDNPHKIVDTKKNIARVNTVLQVLKNGGKFEVVEEKPKTKKTEKKVTKTTTKSIVSKAKKEVGGKD